MFHSAEEHPEASDAYSESVDELFVATFDSMRDTAADAIRRICDFIGELVKFIIFVVCFSKPPS